MLLKKGGNSASVGDYFQRWINTHLDQLKKKQQCPW